jgi:hypothetical protein
MKMTTKQAEVANKVESTGLATVSDWNGRAYINIKSSVRSFRGCQTHKVYIDADGAVINHRGKGTVPSQYNADCEELSLAIGQEIKA